MTDEDHPLPEELADLVDELREADESVFRWDQDHSKLKTCFWRYNASD